MTPSSSIVLVTGFGLGFSDACFMTQVTNIEEHRQIRETDDFRHMPFWLDRLETIPQQHLEYSNFSNLWPSLLPQPTVRT